LSGSPIGVFPELSNLLSPPAKPGVYLILIKYKREPIPEDVKFAVWRRDGGRCVICGSKEKLEFDHIIPVSKGGSNTVRNIQLLCESCNRKKSNKI
jgi:5-methylcytosine-specific restriction endonuclease McrA